MIRRGKTEGWLQLPAEALLPWATMNEAKFEHTLPGVVPGRGGALLATEDLDARGHDSQVLLTVPKDLILSLERIQEHAKADQTFREVLDSLGDFGRVLAIEQLLGPTKSSLTFRQTTRGAILSFLLLQASISCPHLSKPVGVHSAFTEYVEAPVLFFIFTFLDDIFEILNVTSYVKSLPLEDLPTFWTLEELQLLVGTTLRPAVFAKLKSLEREYALFCTSAESTRWHQMFRELVEFEDWCLVDAMYRSRALEFPGIGDCMVPCIDIANHESEGATIAIYEKDADGNAVLFLRDGKRISRGHEVTITYGDEKGACEMLFSYGFLDSAVVSAETLFLDLSIPTSDLFHASKTKIADCAPGFKIIDAGGGEIEWIGDFIWLMCANEEDGLRFKLARTVDEEGEETQAFLGEQELTGGAAQLRALLEESELWDVYRLRAITILQQRIFAQLQILHGTQEDMEAAPHGDDTNVRQAPYQLAMKLRGLEFDLMEKAYETFEAQMNQLAASSVVVHYLAQVNGLATPSEEEEFS